MGLDVWFDEDEIAIGESVVESVDRGLSNSEYGIVILSENFFEKHWTQYELNGLISRQASEEKTILPLWYEIDKEEIREYSPTLADIYAEEINEGNISRVATKICNTISFEEDILPKPEEAASAQPIPSSEVESIMGLETTRIPPNDIKQMDDYFKMYSEEVIETVEEHDPLFDSVELPRLIDIISASLRHNLQDFREFSTDLSIDEKEAGRYVALQGLESKFG